MNTLRFLLGTSAGEELPGCGEALGLEALPACLPKWLCCLTSPASNVHPGAAQAPSKQSPNLRTSTSAFPFLSPPLTRPIHSSVSCPAGSPAPAADLAAGKASPSPAVLLQEPDAHSHGCRGSTRALSAWFPAVRVGKGRGDPSREEVARKQACRRSQRNIPHKHNRLSGSGTPPGSELSSTAGAPALQPYLRRNPHVYVRL